MLNTANVTSMSSMFSGCYSLTSIPMLNTAKVWDMGYMFYGCYSLTSIPMLDTTKVTNMGSMFSGCYSLTSIPMLDTTKVTNMGSMFNICYSLQTANLENIKNTCIFDKTSLLTKESILYLINNEAATSAITITLSSYCYNKYSTDADVTAALANHPNVSLAK